MQEKHGMPDAVPADTVANAQRLVSHLCRSAPDVICSYPLTEDEADQTPSVLLESLLPDRLDADADPGWFAADLANRVGVADAADPVPPIAPWLCAP